MLAFCAAVPALQQCLSSSDPIVRRRAVATLGELVFYFSSEGTNSLRTRAPKPAALVAEIVQLLQPSEDAVTRHYSAKILENMMTTKNFWAEQFATVEAATGLLEVLP